MDMGMDMFSEEEEAEDTSMKLYLQVRNQNPYLLDPNSFVYREEEHKWYVVFRDADYDASAVEIRGMTRHFARDATSVCVNSTVYVIGGRELRLSFRINFNPQAPSFDVCMHPLLSDLWYTDTYIDDDDGSVCARGWIKGASMIHPRSESCAVSVDGKIYVFGGVPCPSSTTWAEVYDIKSNCWSLLAVPDPDMISLDVRSCVVLHLLDIDEHNKYNKKRLIKKKKHILVYISELGSLYSYDVILGNWELFDSDFGNWATELVLVSSASSSTAFLLTLLDGMLHGYHLGQRKWFHCPVSGLEGNNNALPHPESVPCCHDIRLVSLGSGNGNLYVLWSTNTGDSGICVHCTNLTVYEEDGQSSLAAKVESTNVFKHDKGEDFISCLALATRRGKKRAGQTLYMEEEEEKKKIKH